MAVRKVSLAPRYKPHARQLRVHSSNARFLSITAGVRGGKTYSAIVEFIRRIYRDVAALQELLKAGKAKPCVGTGPNRVPALLYWVISPVHELGLPSWRWFLECCPPGLIEYQREHPRRVWLRPNVLVEWKSADTPELLVGASVRGMLLDEACRIKAQTWVGSLRGRLADTEGWSLFASSPLGGRLNWVYQMLVAQSGIDPEIENVSWTTSDNPFIARAEIESARRNLPAEWFKREFEASWDSFGGTIFPQFGDQHIISEKELRLLYRLPNRTDSNDFRKLCRRIVVGQDFGFTAPGAQEVMGVLNDQRVIVFEESYAPERPVLGPPSATTWLSEGRRLRENWGASMFACDPSQPGAINDLASNNLPTIGADNDVYQGIRRLASAMSPTLSDGRPGFLVLNTCTNLIRELRNYQWKPNKEQTGFVEKPADGQSDHSIDAARYALMELRPVETRHNSAWGG